MGNRLLGVALLASASWWMVSSFFHAGKPAAPPSPPPAPPSAEVCAMVAPRDYAALPRGPVMTRDRHKPAAQALVSVREFDVLGIRLGMTVQDVELAVRCSDAFHGQPRLSASSCASDTIVFDRAWRIYFDTHGGEMPSEAAKSCVDRFNAGDDKLNIIVEFTEDVPAHPGDSIAERITLDQPIRQDSTSLAALSEAASRKYGNPRLGTPDSGFWGGEPYGTPELKTRRYYSRWQLELTDANERKWLESARSAAVSDAKPVAIPRF